jgi:hypothetical protein
VTAKNSKPIQKIKLSLSKKSKAAYISSVTKITFFTDPYRKRGDHPWCKIKRGTK